MRTWLARTLPPSAFVAAWFVLMVCGSAGVIATWITVMIDPRAARVGSAVFATLLIGIPIAREWRHVGEVFGRPK